MSSSPNHPYYDTSSSSSSCSSLDISQEEFNKSSPKKDSKYWSQRSKNNLSAKRSRVKRRMNDLVLETKLTQLTNENEILRAKIDMLTRKFGQEKPTVFNQSVNNPSMTTKTEQLSLPIKLRFKLLSNS